MEVSRLSTKSGVSTSLLTRLYVVPREWYFRASCVRRRAAVSF